MTRPTPRIHTTRAGVRIGSAYTPKPLRPEGDALRLQAALLEPRTTGEQTLTQRVLGALWRAA